MSKLHDATNVHHLQDPTSASTIIASYDPHSRLPTTDTDVDMISRSPTTSKVKGDYGPIFALPGDGMPPTIPIRNNDHPRTLVLCFDGTGGQFQNDNSNIVKFTSMLMKEDNDKQLAGVGTYNSPHIANPWRAKIRLWIDLLFAGSLDAHVMGGYEFLMQNYRYGDKISIFGFSRGAYTARCLAGVLDIVGLLPPGNQQQVPFLYRIYKDTFVKTTTSGEESLLRRFFGKVKSWFTRPNPLQATVAWKQAIEFKKAFSVRDITVDFLGVWDTVESVALVPAQRPFAPSDNMIRAFRHALSLDEHRTKFRPDFWNRPTQYQSDLLHAAGVTVPQTPGQPPTDVEEVWFAGCHCDVGGGSVSNEEPYSLARIPLRWMVRECFKSNTGILFHTNKFNEIGLDPTSVFRGDEPSREALIPTEQFRIEIREKDPLPIDVTKLLKDPRCRSLEKPGFAGEDEEELRDAMSAVYDRLEMRWWWWILEYLPLPYRYQTGNDWKIGRSLNRGYPRIIPQPRSAEKLKVHRSVKTRMMAEYRDERKRARGEMYRPGPQLFGTSDFEKQVEWVGR